MTQPLPNFRSVRKTQGPPWLVGNLDGSESELVWYALDLLKDAAVERARKALLWRMPQQDANGTPAPDDALAAIGRDRRIVRGISETSAAYAARLVQWLNDWQVAGNPFALMQQLSAYMGPLPNLRTVDVRGNWFSWTQGVPSVALNQANWDWDGSANALQRWSRFWVIIYPNGLWTKPSGTYNDGGTWGNGRAWGATITPTEAQSLQGIVSDWKPAGTKCVNIILAFDNTSFNPATARDGTGLPNGTWGHWSTGGRTRVSARLSTAAYLDGA